jgi:hypothetical protein
LLVHYRAEESRAIASAMSCGTTLSPLDLPAFAQSAKGGRLRGKEPPAAALSFIAVVMCFRPEPIENRLWDRELDGWLHRRFFLKRIFFGALRRRLVTGHRGINSGATSNSARASALASTAQSRSDPLHVRSRRYASPATRASNRPRNCDVLLLRKTESRSLAVRFDHKRPVLREPREQLG